MLLGINSIDQVIFGALLGIWLSLSLHYCIRDIICKHVIDLTTMQYSETKEFLAYKILTIWFLLMAFTISLDAITIKIPSNKWESTKY